MSPRDAFVWLQGRALPWAGVQRLLAGGADLHLVAQLLALGLLGAGRVAVAADGALFEPEGPDARLLLGAGYDVDELGRDTVAEVVALSTTCEDEWALLTGAADILGADVLEDAVAAERRFVRLYSTPMDWLRAGGAGVCVLQWNRVALAALRGLPESCTLVVDPGARERLRGMLAYGGLPQVAEDRPNFGRVA